MPSPKISAAPYELLFTAVTESVQCFDLILERRPENWVQPKFLVYLLSDQFKFGSVCSIPNGHDLIFRSVHDNE